mmetsp:Transcript_20165/g.36236  ORF Transcript_20165/g.36236 Transcript_20165/m.36236 type:complete len:262 (-) Transcript_20165:1955-2740(-)
MLKSSMKATSFLPPGGAKTPFVRFSNLPSMVSWSELLEVWALKLMIMWLLSEGRFSRRAWMIMVLPTPTLPTSMAWWKLRTRAEMTNRFRIVSTVGTRILKKGRSGAGLKVALSFDSHDTHVFVFGSSAYSKTVSIEGYRVSISRMSASNFLRPSSSNGPPMLQITLNKNQLSMRAGYASASSGETPFSGTAKESKSLVRVRTPLSRSVATNSLQCRRLCSNTASTYLSISRVSTSIRTGSFFVANQLVTNGRHPISSTFR